MKKLKFLCTRAVAARNAIPASAPPPGTTSTAPPPKQKPSQGSTTKKTSNAKNALKGVVVKKKPTRPAPSEPKVVHPSKPLQTTKADDVSTNTEKDDETQTGSNKKPKISPSSS